MEDAPCSIRPRDELKRVFPTLLSCFPWRRGRSMIFSGKLEQLFLMGKSLFMLRFPCCNLVCAFAPVFCGCGKSSILSAK